MVNNDKENGDDNHNDSDVSDDKCSFDNDGKIKGDRDDDNNGKEYDDIDHYNCY